MAFAATQVTSNVDAIITNLREEDKDQMKQWRLNRIRSVHRNYDLLNSSVKMNEPEALSDFLRW